MPELPDLEVYRERIGALAGGSRLTRLRIVNPFVLRSVAPRPADFDGRRLHGTARIGKRLVLKFEGGPCAVMHLMILGRLHWRPPGGKAARGTTLCAFEFESGSLTLTESGTRRRAALHLVDSEAGLAQFERGGLEPLAISADEFCERLARDNHTLKRALTDPSVFAGIGNAYSDEILHQARLSPFRQTRALDREDCLRLHDATQLVLREWSARLLDEARAAGWPEKVTAFRPGMAVHGKFGQPCPVCGAPVQRIVYADNEANYCARCQTGGKVLADRALSRLLKDSWPRSIEELEK